MSVVKKTDFPARKIVFPSAIALVVSTSIIAGLSIRMTGFHCFVDGSREVMCCLSPAVIPNSRIVGTWSSHTASKVLGMSSVGKSSSSSLNVHVALIISPLLGIYPSSELAIASNANLLTNGNVSFADIASDNSLVLTHPLMSISTPNFSGACRKTSARILPSDWASRSLMMNLPSPLHTGQLLPMKNLVSHPLSLHCLSMNQGGVPSFLVSTQLPHNTGCSKTK